MANNFKHMRYGDTVLLQLRGLGRMCGYVNAGESQSFFGILGHNRFVVSRLRVDWLVLWGV